MTTRHLHDVSDVNVVDIPKQFYSKWRKKWITFKSVPTTGEIFGLKKYNYELR